VYRFIRTNGSSSPTPCCFPRATQTASAPYAPASSSSSPHDYKHRNSWTDTARLNRLWAGGALQHTLVFTNWRTSLKAQKFAPELLQARVNYVSVCVYLFTTLSIVRVRRFTAITHPEMYHACLYRKYPEWWRNVLIHDFYAIRIMDLS